MKSATRPPSRAIPAAAAPFRHTRATRRRRRPATPQKDFKDLSSFEKIVFACCIPAGAIFWYLEDEEPTYRSLTEESVRSGLFQVAMLEMALGLSVGSVLWCLLKGIAFLLRKIQRPKYYPKERLRRQALARERRRIRRRTTINPAPTADELLAQWAKIKKNPAEMLRFGSMLCDLEAYVDNSLLRDENGEIVGRNPGIRGWLNANCQPLAVRYKTVMGYKAMAEKFRQAVGLADPYPATIALDGFANAAQMDEDANRKNMVRKSTGGDQGDVGEEGSGTCQNTVRKDGVARAGEKAAEAQMALAAVCVQARRNAEKMLAECGKSQRGVRLVLAARLAPDQVPPEIEREERRRQGLPPRDGLAERFARMMA